MLEFRFSKETVVRPSSGGRRLRCRESPSNARRPRQHRHCRYVADWFVAYADMRSDGKGEVYDESASDETTERGPPESDKKSRCRGALHNYQDGTKPQRQTETFEFGLGAPIGYGVIEGGQHQRSGESEHDSSYQWGGR